MKPTTSIWLDEYEGLLPIPAGRPEPQDATPASPALPEHEAVSPHFELTPVNLEKTTWIAIFE